MCIRDRPEVSWAEISTPLAGAIDRGDIKRACLQIVESPGATNQAVQLIRNIRGISRIFPISVCVAPTSISRAGLFFRAGASQIGLPIDAASKEIYLSLIHILDEASAARNPNIRWRKPE